LNQPLLAQDFQQVHTIGSLEQIPINPVFPSFSAMSKVF
jgi:hypothetical protein